MLLLHWFDIAVLTGYFAVVIGIGLLARRRIKTADDYYLGGHRFGKMFMTMYAFGAGTHADSAVGLMAQTYKLGMAGIWYQWCQIFNTPFYWLLSPIFRRARCLTTGDIYEMRYGPSLGILYGFWGVAINIGYLGVTLYGSARLIEALTAGKISVTWAILLMVGAFVFYSLIGGMVATIWNEFLQGILTLLMSFMLIPFLWWTTLIVKPPHDNEAEYRKLIHHKDWEIPVPGREAVVGFFVVFGVSLGLHIFVLWICHLFRN